MKIAAFYSFSKDVAKVHVKEQKRVNPIKDRCDVVLQFCSNSLRKKVSVLQDFIAFAIKV